MRDFLETVAQQIDKVAAKPLDAVMFIGGGFVMWQWVGWWGVIIFACFLALMHLIVDATVYVLCRRQTYAKYGDSTVWLSGFHPFRARSIARKCDRAIKQHGESAFTNELHRLALANGSEITVTTTDAEGNRTTRSSTLPHEIELEIWQAPFAQTGLSAFSGGYVPGADYERVWISTLNDLGIVYLTGDEENDVLGMIYSRFQRVDEEHMPPEGYTGRSLTAGDLVRLDGRWFYCALEGWEEVSQREADADRV